MTTLATIALVAITLGVGLLCILVYNILLTEQTNTRVLRDIRKFQLNPRTRISTASVQSGPVSEEKQLTQLGRASSTRARRVVVGGDPDSDLYMSLSRPFDEDDDE